jgi:hypothetical protein
MSILTHSHVNSFAQTELLKEILKNPEDLSLQKIYHDWLLDDDRDSLQECIKLLPSYIYKDNGYFITQLFVTNLYWFIDDIKILRMFPITKIFPCVMPYIASNGLYYFYPNLLKDENTPYKIYKLLKNYKSGYICKGYESSQDAIEQLGLACLRYLREH